MVWCASSPHHITSVFVPVYTSSPESTGSLGIGIAVEPRLTVCYPGKSTPEASTIKRSINIIGGFQGIPRVNIIMPLPPAKGYAVSAASATSFNLAIAAEKRLSYLDALRIAHISEVSERTGLGDVLAISCGIGVVVRFEAGRPGLGKVDCFPIPSSVEILALEAPQQMYTRDLLMQRYLIEGRELALSAIKRVFSEKSFEVFVEESQRFTLEMRLLDYIDKGLHDLLNKIPGIIGYYAKKRLVIVFIESDRFLDARDILLNKKYTVRRLQSSEHGPRVWWNGRRDTEVSSEISLVDDKGEDS